MFEITLNHDEPELFVASEWQENKYEPNFKYLVYRCAVMLLFFLTWLNTIFTDGADWPLYLTNWSYSACTLQATLVFLMLAAAFSDYESWRSIQSAYRLYWLTNIVGTTSAFFVTTVYFSFLHDYQQAIPAMNFIVHGNNSIMMYLDLWIVAHPINIPHGIYPLVFCGSYVVFSLAHYLVNSNNYYPIYVILDWSKPSQTAGLIVALFLVLVVFHLLVCLTATLRRNLACRLYNKTQ